MKIFSWFGLSGLIILQVACGGGDSAADTPQGEAVTEVEVGKLIFEDTRLSFNGNQSCASCHDASKGFADPDVSMGAPVSEGSIPNSFGNRNAPTSAYAGFSPKLFEQITDPKFGQVYVGGQFLDGRRDTLEDQAKDPFLNPVEMANDDEQAVVDKVKSAPYADKFKRIFGADVFNNTSTAYNNIAHAIAAFERSPEMNRFDSKFDCYLQDADQYPLTPEEKLGLDVFNSSEARCAECHTIDPRPPSGKVLLTNFQYFNIGVPKNLSNPSQATDNGLGGRADISSNENGKFKTPSLRNVAITGPYMHNGVFATLKDVMDFYAIPEKAIETDPAPEVKNNIAGEVDFLDFTADPEFKNIIAFMETLTDGTGVGICF